MDQRIVESSGWYAAAFFWLALAAAYLWYTTRAEKHRWVVSGKSLGSLRTHRLRRLLAAGLMGGGMLLLFRFVLVPLVEGQSK
jgi:hypothetical protein